MLLVGTLVCILFGISVSILAGRFCNCGLFTKKRGGRIHRTLSGVMCCFPIVKRGRGRAARCGQRQLEMQCMAREAVSVSCNF